MARLIQVRLNGSKGKVRIANNLSGPFEIHNGLKPGDTMSFTPFYLILGYVLASIKKKLSTELNDTTQALTYADYLDLVNPPRNIQTSRTRD